MTSRKDFISAGMLFQSAVAAAGLLLSAYLLWKLRSLIPPVAVGGLAAYICRPLVALLERYLVTRRLAIGLLLLAFVVVALFIVNQVRAARPTEIGAIELKVRGLYRINEGYKSLMGLNPSLARGNWIYGLAGAELDPRVDEINQFLALTPEETSQFLASRPHGPDAPSGSDRLLDHYRANLHTLKMRAQAARSEKDSAGAARRVPAETQGPLVKTPLAILGTILSVWFIAPLVFLFLLGDTGEIKRGLLSAVPNPLFEPALRVLEDLDRALGNYMRGIFLECALLGLSVTVLLVIVGVAPRWAIVIGIFAGATNVVPYMGTAFALFGGLAYALLTEDMHPVLPMVNEGNFVFWVVAAVVAAELLKNFFFEPVVLGGAVKLHPLVVVIGIVGGGILFDLAGVLLAIPTITIFKVSISSTARQLKAYGRI